MSPTITHSGSTQEIKTEPIPAKRLESEQETTPQTQEEQPLYASEWIANEWTQNDWGMNCCGWGMPMPMYRGENMPGAQTKGSYKGGKSPEAWTNLWVFHGGKAYAKSDWATKTNERPVANKCLY